MKFEVQDANGKTFSGRTEDLFRINGDFNAEDSSNESAVITDARRNRVDVVHNVEFVDSRGNVIDAKQAIADDASGKKKIIALDADIEATHSGKNHNYCVYYEESMEKDCETFMNPFEKPLLKNHNSYSGEPIGRIKNAYHGPSALTTERSAIHVKARITDRDAINKFMDGRYNTVSIGGTMGTVTCSVCGKTILKDGILKFCGHWKGETYKDQTCYWGVKDIEYNELSVVNVPADDYAQTMRITVITDGDNNKDSKEDSQMDGNTNTNVTPNATGDATQNNGAGIADNVKKQVCDLIDSLIGSGNNTGAQAPATQSQTDTQQTETAPATETTDNAQQNPEQAANDSTTPDVAKQLEDALAKVTELTAELEKVKAELAESKDAAEKTAKELEDSKAECNSYKEKCVTLATANKEFVIDGIISKENVAEDKIQERKEELMKMSMKELDALSAKASEKPAAQRQPASVQNPTLPVEDNKDNSGNADVNKADSKNAKKTVDDFAKEIVGKLIK